MRALEGLENLADWGEIEALLPAGREKAATGRPGYPALMLFRALMLGQLYRLSDVALSNQLFRDPLFRRFCRIELDQGVPDAVTLGRFRASLEGRMEMILDRVNAAPAARRLILTEGQIAIVDASVIEAAQSGLVTGDPEAGSAVKHDAKGRMRATWGWKGFVNVDEDNFVHAVDFTSGNAAEVRRLPNLVRGHEARLYDDAANIGPISRDLCAVTGMEDHVQRRRSHSRTLTTEAVARNEDIGLIRAGVERLFAHWKRVWGMGRTRLKGLARSRVWWGLAAVTWNLTHADRLRRTCG